MRAAMAATSASTPSPVLADTGKYSANSNSVAVISWRATCSLDAASTLLTTQKPDFGTPAATNRSPRPIGCVASTTNATTSTPPSASVAVSFKRSPSRVRGLWIPGVSTNTICTSGRVRTPRIWVRVVCGLSDTIDTLVPSMRLSRVDFPTLGRPTSEANPERTSGPRARLGAVGGSRLLGRLELGDADAADAPALHLLGGEPVAVELDRFTLGRHVAEQVEHQATDGVPVTRRQL